MLSFLPHGGSDSPHPEERNVRQLHKVKHLPEKCLHTEKEAAHRSGLPLLTERVARRSMFTATLIPSVFQHQTKHLKESPKDFAGRQASDLPCATKKLLFPSASHLTVPETTKRVDQPRTS